MAEAGIIRQEWVEVTVMGWDECGNPCFRERLGCGLWPSDMILRDVLCEMVTKHSCDIPAPKIGGCMRLNRNLKYHVENPPPLPYVTINDVMYQIFITGMYP